MISVDGKVPVSHGGIVWEIRRKLVQPCVAQRDGGDSSLFQIRGGLLFVRESSFGEAGWLKWSLLMTFIWDSELSKAQTR